MEEAVVTQQLGTQGALLLSQPVLLDGLEPEADQRRLLRHRWNAMSGATRRTAALVGRAASRDDSHVSGVALIALTARKIVHSCPFWHVKIGKKLPAQLRAPVP